ncbi:hypothetical protein Pcinc_005386 [Petrolisthes cinctipes]|uniref:Uncharacterized protein n=1 Tax=Petrolisthes cinctipes TaxID=88211 RepID=A0AAE1GF07_PETCI|nr:hypothetical protein Pcinc_005386 [Petrolisthes cinctipes]
MEMVRRNTKPGKLKHWTRRRGRMGTREEARRDITTRGNEGEESISEDERIDRREGVGRGSGVGGEITEYERIYGKEGVGRGSGEERENGEDVIAEVGEGRGIGRRDGKGESSEDERTKVRKEGEVRIGQETRKQKDAERFKGPSEWYKERNSEGYRDRDSERTRDEEHIIARRKIAEM